MLDLREVSQRKMFVSEAENQARILSLKNNSKYCTAKSKERWESEIDKLEFVSPFLGEEKRESLFRNYESCAQVLRAFSNQASWSQVARLVEVQGHTEESLVNLTRKLLSFSNNGTTFAEHRAMGRIKPTVEISQSKPKILSKT